MQWFLWLQLGVASGDSAIRYSRNSIYWGLASTAVYLLVLLLLLFSGFSGGLQARLEARIGRRWLERILFFFVFTLVTAVLTLPLDYYLGFRREHLYGLSRESLAGWWQDSLKELVLSLVAGSLFISILYPLLRKFPRTWWIGASAVGIVFLIVLMLIAPVYIDPWFNRFEPVQDPAVRDPILQMAHRNGIDVDRVYQVDSSRRTEKVNAYVAGLFNTKRIVLGDTLLARFTPEETTFVMGHEMGHYVLGHTIKFVLGGSAMIVILFLMTFWLSRVLVDRFAPRWGFWKVSNIASLPLLLFLVTLLATLAMPGLNSFSRRMEAEADRFGLQQIQDKEVAIRAFEKLGDQNLAERYPPRLIEILFYNHPALGRRIENAKNMQ